MAEVSSAVMFLASLTTIEVRILLFGFSRINFVMRCLDLSIKNVGVAFVKGFLSAKMFFRSPHFILAKFSWLRPGQRQTLCLSPMFASSLTILFRHFEQNLSFLVWFWHFEFGRLIWKKWKINCSDFFFGFYDEVRLGKMLTKGF